MRPPPWPFADDGKATTWRLALRNAATAVSGPTRGGSADGRVPPSLPPFAWQGRWRHMEHRGMPELFDFDWELMQP